MKLFSALILASSLFTLVSCSGNPSADGEKAAKMHMELPGILIEYGYDSKEYEEAASEASEFAAECQKKYGDDENKSAEFNEAYFRAIKAEMQKNSK